MAPEPRTTAKFISFNNANSLKATIFHTMAFKLSLENHTDHITIPTKRYFLKVLNNVCKVEKKNICFEQYARLHLDGPKIAICETASNMVLVLNSTFTFTTKDEYFRVAIAEACDAFNKMLLHFGYTQRSKFMIQKLIRSTRHRLHFAKWTFRQTFTEFSKNPSLTFTLHALLCLISSSTSDADCS